MKKIFLLLVTLYAFAGMAQSKYSPSAQLFRNQSTEMQRAPYKGQERYIHTTLQVSDADALEQYGILVGTQSGNLVTALVPATLFDQLSEIPEITYIDANRKSHTLLNKALPDIGYDRILTSSYTATPYLGKGVIVGVVDLGFQWDHPAFCNADGSTRILAAWNQNDTTGTAPEKYNYGSLYDTPDEILNGLTGNVETHATHVTGIAAGSAIEGIPFGGVAREASLVLVEAQHSGGSSMYDEGITDGINFIFEYAEKMGMPCVINLSLGNNFGPHDGTSLFDQMCDSLQGPGRLIVGAMGNSGQQHYHLGYDFDAENTEFRAGLTGGLPILDVWSEEPVQLMLEFYHGHVDTILDTTGWIPLDSIYETTLKYFHREITVTATSQRSPFNNKYNVMITTSGVNNIGNSYFALKAKGESGRLDIWTNAPGAEFSSRGFDGWLEGDTEMTLNETGGTGKRITSVGAYTSDTTKHCINNRTYEVGYELNAVSPFSSRGFTADGRTKPDIITPGSLITSAFNDVLAGDPLSYYYDTIEGIYIVHNDSCYYGVNSGTSMATPIVTGTYAIWLQAKPDLTPEEAKEILYRTATQDEYTTRPAEAGYGKVNPYDGLCYIFDTNNISLPVMQNIAMIYPSVGDGSFTLRTPEQPSMVRIYNASGILIATHHTAGLEGSIDIAIPNAPKGIYYIQAITDKNIYTSKYICQ